MGRVIYKIDGHMKPPQEWYRVDAYKENGELWPEVRDTSLEKLSWQQKWIKDIISPKRVWYKRILSLINNQ